MSGASRSLWTAALCASLVGCGAPAPRATGGALGARVGSEPAPSGASKAPDDHDLANMVQRSLPAVALVLGEKDGAKIGYGAGLIVSDDGRILTNYHVIEGAKKLGVMLYKPSRASYTPMDGGLDRYIFENAKDILPVALEAQDEVGDLAVLKGDFDTSFAPALPPSMAAPRLGERVYALGHPQETVWSFTAGAVSALHVGAIQHDAVVSRGSSGGPLLNARGEVVGINTARVVSEARGFAFARPIAMADRLLRRPGEATALDLSTPERAMYSCWHATELESARAKDCYDWGALWAVFVASVRSIEQRPPPSLSPDALRRLLSFIRQPGALERAREEAAKDPAWASATFIAPPFFSFEVFALRAAEVLSRDEPARKLDPEPKEVAEGREIFRKRLSDTGLRDLGVGTKGQREVLRKGGRIEASKPLGDDRVWFRVTGRNIDGSLYMYSELWVRVGERWLQREPPLEGDVAELPADWPRPVRTVEPLTRAMAAEITARLAAKR